MDHNVQLTSRDLAVLHDLYQNGVMSFRQLWDGHFTGSDRTTASKRLCRLNQGGYLQAHQIGAIYHQELRKEIGVVYSLTRAGLRALREAFVYRRYRADPLPLNTTTLYHDLLLVDLLSVLRQRFPSVQIDNGKLLTTTMQSERRLPDATMRYDIRGEAGCIAVELELTQKSERR